MESEIKKPDVLLVDDTPENLDILVNVLSNYKCRVASNGEIALKIVNSNKKPDLILMDINMPGMSGYEVCKKIKANELTKDIPVIFVTAQIEDDDIIKGFQAGGQDYIKKPFNTEEVFARVKTHLELKEKREELNSLNRLLEAKVADRTERLKIANEKLEQSNVQLEKANKELQNLDYAKSNFLQIISHEIRTPLSGIIGITDLLKDSLDSTEYSEYLEMMKESGERLEKFSEKALLITELQAKKSEILKDSNQAAEIVDLVIEDLEKEINHKKFNIKNKILPKLKIYADPFYLKVCLKNVLENAINFSKENEQIIIMSSHANESASVEIIDHGSGFSKTALDNLFKFFSIGEDPVDKDFGLGLATVKLIMDAHSGILNVNNNDTGGATVKLEFPYT